MKFKIIKEGSVLTDKIFKVGDSQLNFGIFARSISFKYVKLLPPITTLNIDTETFQNVYSKNDAYYHSKIRICFKPFRVITERATILKAGKILATGSYELGNEVIEYLKADKIIADKFPVNFYKINSNCIFF